MAAVWNDDALSPDPFDRHRRRADSRARTADGYCIEKFLVSTFKPAVTAAALIR